MVAYAGEAILHAAVAAIVVESLLRVWRVRVAGERLRLRLLVLLCPIVLPVAFGMAAPFRAEDSFGTDWAIFAGERWNQLRLAGVGLWSAGVAVLSAAGLLLFVRDLGGFLVARLRRDPRGLRTGTTPVVTALVAQVRALAEQAGIRPPGLTVIDSPSPVLLCAGVVRPAIVISTGTLVRLDAEELRAALTHELAHVVFRDPLMGWGLMALRALQAFNPVAQVVGRQAVQEIEWRADAAVMDAGQSEALVRALVKLSRDTSDGSAPLERLGLSGRVARSAARAALDARCGRLLDTREFPACGHPGLRVAAAAVGLAALLFFVV